MNISLILKIATATLAIISIGLILLQARGIGLSRNFGSFGGFYRSKRGLEKLIFILTIILVTALAGVLLAKLRFS